MYRKTIEYGTATKLILWIAVEFPLSIPSVVALSIIYSQL